MFITKRPSGYYYLFYTDELGKRRTVSTRATTKSEALKFLQQFRATDVQRRVRLQHISLSEFTTRYIEYSRTRFSPKYVESIRTSLRRLERAIGDIPLSRIGICEVEQFVGTVSRDSSDRTVRVYFVTCASAFETAKRWEHIDTNPFRRVKRPKLRELLPCHLTVDEFVQVLRAEPDAMLRDLYFCAVSTGMRLGELGALQWTDVDFAQRVIRVRNTEFFTTKSKRTRTLPMTAQVYSLLMKRKEKMNEDFVFTFGGRPITKDIASRNFKQCVKKVGLNPSFHFHSLRHSFATWLVQSGVSIFAIQKLLGHSSVAMTQIYSHLAPSELHETVDRISIPLEAKEQ